MARKRKRARSLKDKDTTEPCKRIKTAHAHEQAFSKHPTLRLYYRKISTLREHLLSSLPKKSKTRRRKILSREDDCLDKTLICIRDIHESGPDPTRSKDFETFSQQVSLTAGSSIDGGSTSQSELVDFAIYFLFHRVHHRVHRPPHMLCHGYQRAGNPRQVNEDQCALGGIPGIVSHYPNNNVEILKDASWTEILGLLGNEGERIMLDIVLDCAVFRAVDGGNGNCFQISGEQHNYPYGMNFINYF